MRAQGSRREGFTVLVTGFGPFPGVAVNPTEAVALALDGARIGRARVVGRVLPVRWSEAPLALDAAVAAAAPAALLMLGVAPRAGICVERLAHNRAAGRPDEGGAAGPAAPLEPDGPAALATTLPWRRLCALGAEPSDDAGDYLCNAVFYRALWRFPGPWPRGFVHVPHGPAAPALAFARRAIALLAAGELPDEDPAGRDQSGTDQSMGA